MRPVVVASILCVIALGVTGCASAEGDGSDRRPVAAKKQSEKQGVQHRTVQKREAIPARSTVRRTAALRKGQTRVMRPGRDGVRLTVWRVTVRNGETTAREKVRTTVLRKPLPRVTLVGTLRTYTPRCDSNYTGACVPVASDVDCRGGSGDGPAYVAGPVRVVAHDLYDLDADGDGWGCD